MNQLSKQLVKGYTDFEKSFIAREFKSLADARQESYSQDTIREWVKIFWEQEMTANEVCKRIIAVKLNTKIFGKITFNDFMDADLNGLKDIIPVEKESFYYALLTCKECSKVVSVQKKDLFRLPEVKICEHKTVDTFDLKEMSSKLVNNFQEFTL